MAGSGRVGVIIAGLVLLTGCDSGGDGKATTAAAPASSAAASPSAVDAAVCVELKTVHLREWLPFHEAWQKLVEVSERQDAAATASGIKAQKAMATEWAAALEPLIGQVQQPELRQPMADLLASVKQYIAGDGYSTGNLGTFASTAMTAMSTRCPT
ncbi:hypothetical protein AB0H83_11200 [Dactylosporangium sp. NPDC050688]|uniref:hypothetical protein n=1 Tax=Dactylosporangium sp. NPDC050688 TaxID=3157217 RepID=UPI0033C22E53